MSIRWSLAIQLLALSVFTDAFAVGRNQNTHLIQSADTGPDLALAGSAAQHITKIPRHKTKISSKITAKPTEITNVENEEVKTKEPAVSTNEIEDKAAKSIQSSQDVHGPRSDEARADIASNGTNDATPNTNVTVQKEKPVEPTPASVTNNETAGSKETEDPNWKPESVTEVNGNIIDTVSTTVTITAVDNATNYSTALVNDNVDKGAIESTSNAEETQQPIRKTTTENVSETNNSVSALLAEYTKANTVHELTTEQTFLPPTQNVTEEKKKTSLEELIENKNVQEPKDATLEPINDTDMSSLTTAISSESYSQTRSNDWRRSSELFSELTTEPKTTEDYSKYNKVISKAERLSSSLSTNYGDKLDVTTGTTYAMAMKEKEGPLDDVTMDTSDSWRRVDTAVVTSMRGGYLNHSPDTKNEPRKSDVIPMDEDNETIPKKSTQAIASQSLMVEDKLKDELLTEDRQTEYEIAHSRAQPSRSDEGLNVKPIATGKNHSLYTVSANYKPMKKLDVVPGKPQLRDPDDNSWRNESLNNLGIVFKGKNSTKPFTQVLKNKTETELSSLVERDNRTEAPELRERLEKLAEERKSKKKKTDKSGEVVDYDEASSYFYKTTTDKGHAARISYAARESSQSANRESTSPFNNIFKTYDYENSDDDVEYVTLPFLDLQKSAITKTPTSGLSRSPTTKNWLQTTTKQYLDRKPTVQYFPPRAPTTSRVYVKKDKEEDEFLRKMQAFEPEHDAPVTTAYYVLKEPEVTTTAAKTNAYVPDSLRPEVADEYRGPAEKAYSFRDLMTRIGQEDDYDRVNEYVPSHKVKELATQRQNPVRKEVIDKFMQNYNDNSKKFKVDYPVVYKSRVFHTDGGIAEPASSSASFQRQYRDRQRDRDRDPDCDKMLELAADYELHYYVPEQEELEIGKIIR